MRGTAKVRPRPKAPSRPDYRDLLAQTQGMVRGLESVLSMTVARLGGFVEGYPTGRHNFLQRIDALRDIEQGALGWQQARQIEALQVRLSALRRAANDVTAFDWSENDADAVRAITRLRKEAARC